MVEKPETQEIIKEQQKDIESTGFDTKNTPFDIVAHSLDGTHTHKVRLASDTDWLQCGCGSCLFTIAFAEFADHSDGVVAQCQECGQILEIQKD